MHVSNKYFPFGRGKGKWACWPMSARELDVRIARHALNKSRWGWSCYDRMLAKCMEMRDRFYDKDGRPRFYVTNSSWHGARQRKNGAWHSGPRMQPLRQHANKKYRKAEKRAIRRFLVHDEDIDMFRISTGYWD